MPPRPDRTKVRELFSSKVPCVCACVCVKPEKAAQIISLTVFYCFVECVSVVLLHWDHFLSEWVGSLSHQCPVEKRVHAHWLLSVHGYHTVSPLWVGRQQRACQQAPLAFNVNKRLVPFKRSQRTGDVLKKQLARRRGISWKLLIWTGWTLRILINHKCLGALCTVISCKNVTFKNAFTPKPLAASLRDCGEKVRVWVKCIAMATCNNHLKNLINYVCYSCHNKTGHDRRAQLNESLMSFRSIWFGACVQRKQPCLSCLSLVHLNYRFHVWQAQLFQTALFQCGNLCKSFIIDKITVADDSIITSWCNFLQSKVFQWAAMSLFFSKKNKSKQNCFFCNYNLFFVCCAAAEK